MRKILVIYLAVLAGVFILFTVVDRGSDYVIEKKTWKLDKKKIEIAKDPISVPPHTFKSVIAGYEEIIANHPESRLIPRLRINIGELYALRKDYDKARETFYGIIKLLPGNEEVAAEALYRVGETYEVDENWNQATKIYQSVIQQYPLTTMGLNTPIHIANHYKRKNDFQATMNSYETAIRHYKSISKAQDTKKEGLVAMRHLANCYLDQNRWNEAIETLGSVIENYSTSGFLQHKEIDFMIKTINITAAYKMKDYDIAINLYEGIIARNPAHPLNNYLNKVIDAFNKLKEQGVVVSEL